MNQLLKLFLTSNSKSVIRQTVVNLWWNMTFHRLVADKKWINHKCLHSWLIPSSSKLHYYPPSTQPRLKVKSVPIQRWDIELTETQRWHDAACPHNRNKVIWIKYFNRTNAKPGKGLNNLRNVTLYKYIVNSEFTKKLFMTESVQGRKKFCHNHCPVSKYRINSRSLILTGNAIAKSFFRALSKPACVVSHARCTDWSLFQLLFKIGTFRMIDYGSLWLFRNIIVNNLVA